MPGYVPGYVSKLDAVLRIRCYREEAAHQAFVISKDRLTEEEDQLKVVQGALNRAACDLGEKQGNGANSGEMDLYYNFLRGQSIQAKARKKTIHALGDVCEKKRVVLAHAVKERDVVERIEEDRKVVYIRGMGKKEQGVMDEVAGRRDRGVSLWGSLFLLGFGLLFSSTSFAAPAEAPPPAMSGESRTSAALIKAIEKRTVELDARESHLAIREQQLKLMEQEVSGMLDRNTKLREEIEQKQTQLSAVNEQKLQALSKTYAAMPAEEAAMRLEQVDDSLALNILSRSKPKIAAKFLASMSPAKAAKLSQKLAKPQ